MIGLGGNDTYLVDVTGDIVTEAAGGGTDTVRSTANAYTLGAQVENLVFTGAGNFNGDGNALANQITGGTGNDTLAGAGGNDTILGGDGNDTLNGNGNDDVLDGGIGTDSLSGGAGTDTLTGGVGNDTLNVGNDNDVAVFASGFGNDTVVNFDANAAGGQDLLDIRAFGFTLGNFNAHVTIADVGADTLVTIDGADTIRLMGVGNATTVTIADFIVV